MNGDGSRTIFKKLNKMVMGHVELGSNRLLLGVCEQCSTWKVEKTKEATNKMLDTLNGY